MLERTVRLYRMPRKRHKLFKEREKRLRTAKRARKNTPKRDTPKRCQIPPEPQLPCDHYLTTEILCLPVEFSSHNKAIRYLHKAKGLTEDPVQVTEAARVVKTFTSYTPPAKTLVFPKTHTKEKLIKTTPSFRKLLRQPKFESCDIGKLEQLDLAEI